MERADAAGRLPEAGPRMRAYLPGSTGQERSRNHLTAEAAPLVPMQVGRVRADLQQRPAESTRQMIRAVTVRCEKVTHHLNSAREQSEHQRSDRAGATAVLAHSERTLRRIVTELQVDDPEHSRAQDPRDWDGRVNEHDPSGCRPADGQ